MLFAEDAMQHRQLFFFTLVLAAMIGGGARAFVVQPYDKASADAAIAEGKTVIVETYASWCPICQAQATAIDAMKDKPVYKDIVFFRVDTEKQKDVVKALHSPRSTFIVYRGGKEISRQSWGATDEDVARVLMSATK
jgi:thiol-disulfide isomerase/thioredoxin